MCTSHGASDGEDSGKDIACTTAATIARETGVSGSCLLHVLPFLHSQADLLCCDKRGPPVLRQERTQFRVSRSDPPPEWPSPPPLLLLSSSPSLFPSFLLILDTRSPPHAFPSPSFLPLHQVYTRSFDSRLLRPPAPSAVAQNPYSLSLPLASHVSRKFDLSFLPLTTRASRVRALNQNRPLADSLSSQTETLITLSTIVRTTSQSRSQGAGGTETKL